MATFASLPKDVKQEIGTYLTFDDIVAFGKTTKDRHHRITPLIQDCCLEPTPREIAKTIILLKRTRRFLFGESIYIQNTSTKIVGLVQISEGGDEYNVFGGNQHGTVAEKDLEQALRGTTLYAISGNSILVFATLLRQRKPCLEDRDFLKVCLRSWLLDRLEFFTHDITILPEWRNFYLSLERYFPKEYKIMDYYKTIFGKYNPMKDVVLADSKEAREATIAMIEVLDFNEMRIPRFGTL